LVYLQTQLNLKEPITIVNLSLDENKEVEGLTDKDRSQTGPGKPHLWCQV
jgi:hypothetical protein